MSRVKVKASNLIHCIALCTDCGKHWDKYKSARSSGRRHAQNTGHSVTVELGYSIRYRYRVSDSAGATLER